MKRDAVDIIPYQPQWLAQFKTAKKDLENALGSFALDIEHIGSTSIVNMVSKDRIDIQIGVKHISRNGCDAVNSCLNEFRFPSAYLSKDHLPPNQVDESDWDKIYLKGVTHRWDFKANIHIRKLGAKNYHYALLFRDYLRQNPESALAYARLKLSLAKITRFDRAAYCEIKDPACDLIMVNAKIWAASKQRNKT